MAFKNKNKDKNKNDNDNVQLMQHIPMAHLTLEDRPIYRVNSSCDEQGTFPYISMKDVYAALNYPGDILIYKDEFKESLVEIHKSTAGEPERIRFYPRQTLYFRCPTQEGNLAPSSADASSTAQHRKDPSLPDSSTSARPTQSAHRTSPSARSARRSRRSSPLVQSSPLRSSARIRSAYGSSQAQPAREGSPQAQSLGERSLPVRSALKDSPLAQSPRENFPQAQSAGSGSAQAQSPFEGSSQSQSPCRDFPQTQSPRDGSSRASPPQFGSYGASPSRTRASHVRPTRSDTGGICPSRRRASTPYFKPTSANRASETRRTAGSSHQYQQSTQQDALTHPTGDATPPAVANLEPVISNIDSDTSGGGGGGNGSPGLSVPAQPQVLLPDHNMLTELITVVGNLNNGTRLRVDRLRLRIDQMQQENWSLQRQNQDLQERNQILQHDIETFLQENENVKHENIALEHMNKERHAKGLAYRTEADELRKTVQGLDDKSKRYQRQVRDLQYWNEELRRLEGTYVCSICREHRSSESGAVESLSSSARLPVFPRPAQFPTFLYPSSSPPRQTLADAREERTLSLLRSRSSQLQVQEPSAIHPSKQVASHHQHLQGQHHQEQNHPYEQHHQREHCHHEQRQQEQYRKAHYREGQLHHQEQPHHREGYYYDERRHHQKQRHQGQHEQHRQRQSSKSAWDHWDTYGFDVIAFDDLPHDDHAWVMPERPDEEGGWITRTISMAARNSALKSELPFLPRAPKGQYTTSKTVESFLKIHRRTVEAVKDVQIYTDGPDGALSSDISSTNADVGSSGRASYVETPQLGGSPACTILIEHDDNAIGAAAATIVRAHRIQSRVSYKVDIRDHRSQGRDSSSEQDDIVAHGSRIEQLQAASAATAARADPSERVREDPHASSARDRRVHEWVQRADDEEEDGDEC